MQEFYVYFTQFRFFLSEFEPLCEFIFIFISHNYEFLSNNSDLLGDILYIRIAKFKYTISMETNNWIKHRITKINLNLFIFHNCDFFLLNLNFILQFRFCSSELWLIFLTFATGFFQLCLCITIVLSIGIKKTLFTIISIVHCD